MMHDPHESKLQVFIERALAFTFVAAAVTATCLMLQRSPSPEDSCFDFCRREPFARPEVTVYDTGYDCSCYEDPH